MTQRFKQLDLSLVEDARLDHDRVVFKLRTGQELTAKLCQETLELYWQVKLRNRRRAFGL